MEQLKIGNKLVLAIMFLWAGLVFYNIGAKALWLDEILVPLTSGHSIRYILERSLSTDFHPPGYYILIKGLMAINDSDAFLRSFSAICGLTSIYVIYLVGVAFWSPATGVLSATFMATNVFSSPYPGRFAHTASLSCSIASASTDILHQRKTQEK